MKQEFSLYFVIHGFVAWICHLDLSKLKLIATGICTSKKHGTSKHTKILIAL